MLRHRERDVTTHLKVLQMVGYDVLASFDSRSSRKPPAKKARLSNLKRSKPEYETKLSDITDQEAGVWSPGIIADLDATHPRKT